MLNEIEDVICPALSRQIELGYCQDLQMAVDDEIVWSGVQDRFSREQEKICLACKKRKDPAAD